MLHRLFLGMLLLALGLTAVPAQAATPAEHARLLQLVNEARAAQGLVPVAASAPLTASAEAYATYMSAANFFSHTGANGSSMVARNEAAGYAGWTWMAENIADGQSSADAVFQAWMNSSGHRANILSPTAREMGIGHAYTLTSTYRHYWSMELGARGNAPVVSAPTATPTPQATATPTPTAASLPVAAARRHRVIVPTAPN